MKADDCIFCKIAAGQISSAKIYEDDDVLAFLDIGPLSDGHTLVIPKQHFEKMHQCPEVVLGKIFSKIGIIAKAVFSAMDADGYNVLCNNGRAAGQLVDHLHFHIIPRNENDGVFNRWPSYSYEAGEVEKIAGEIKKKLF